jgi:hypothetical protein
MPYVGNKPEVGNFRKCDAITTSATATYNLLVGGVAVNPAQNQVICSLNGVVQSSGDSFTIASSQITFASALTSSDVIDFILILGDTLNAGIPSDSSVDASKITANIITGQTALGATPADTDELLISDAGTLKRVDYSYLKSSNTPRFLVTMSGNQTGLSDATITKGSFNTEVFDSDSAYDTSNYKFVVPSGEAGVYYIYAKIDSSADSASQVRSMRTYIYLNGSEYSPSVSEQDPRDNYTLGGAFMAGTLMNLSVADYVEAYSRIDTQGGGTWNIASTFSVFGGFKLT